MLLMSRCAEAANGFRVMANVYKARQKLTYKTEQVTYIRPSGISHHVSPSGFVHYTDPI